MPSRYDRLSAADLTNLGVETSCSPMHVGALLLLGERAGPPLTLAGLRAALAQRLDSQPRLRCVVHRPGPFGGRPLWTADPGFRIERHVRAARVPSPGTRADLLRLTADLLEPPLDRSRPLWRLWLVEGLADGRPALLFELHPRWPTGWPRSGC